MNNPHVKETRFLHYLEEDTYINDVWFDTGLWVEVGGLGLVICTIGINTGSYCNVGFRIVDEKDHPLPPFRTTQNTRHPAHFSMEPDVNSVEDRTPVTFHMIANCQYAKLQIRPSDAYRYADGSKAPGIVRINIIGNSLNDRPWNHKPISTMSAIPLVPNYQGGANTIFNYPQSRMSRDAKDDKPPVKYKDKSFKPLKKDGPKGNN